MNAPTGHRRLRFESLTVLWLVVTAWGCSEGVVESLQAPGYSVTDSARVRMVVNNEPLWGPGEGWDLTPEPLLTLGVVDTPVCAAVP